jgi:hypothetical protein
MAAQWDPPLRLKHPFTVDRSTLRVDDAAKQRWTYADTRLFAQADNFITVTQSRVRFEQHDQCTKVAEAYHFSSANAAIDGSHLATLPDVRDRTFRLEPLAIGLNDPAPPRQKIQSS